jgi:hypothetical protein
MVYDGAFVAAQPREPFLSSGIGEPQQQVAMTGQRRTPADKVFAAQLVERIDKIVLSAQPFLIERNDSRTVAISVALKPVMPLALCNTEKAVVAADVHGASRNTLQGLDVQQVRHGELTHARRIKGNCRCASELPLRLADNAMHNARPPLGHSGQRGADRLHEGVTLVARDRPRSGLNCSTLVSRPREGHLALPGIEIIDHPLHMVPSIRAGCASGKVFAALPCPAAASLAAMDTRRSPTAPATL